MSRLLIGDNLPHLRELESESIDLAYLDPPFNTGATLQGLEGTKCEGVSFNDSWTDTNEPAPKQCAWFLAGLVPKDRGYLTFMALRLIELHRVLKLTGSVYLHCDNRMSHYLKVLLDLLFGQKNYRNEIVWNRTIAPMISTTKGYPKVKDVILFYTKSDKARFNLPRKARNAEIDERKFYMVDEDGRPFRHKELGVDRNGKRERYYLDDAKGLPVTDLWTEDELQLFATDYRTGWPTEKPLPLLQRIIAASSQEGDMVLDPFCGSGTTLVAAEALRRRWIGMEKNTEARRILDIKMRDTLGGLFTPKIGAENTPQEPPVSPLLARAELSGRVA